MNLSEKLFLQDGKQFAYANDIQEKVRELKCKFDVDVDYVEEDIIKEIDEIFGDKLK